MTSRNLWEDRKHYEIQKKEEYLLELEEKIHRLEHEVGRYVDMYEEGRAELSALIDYTYDDCLADNVYETWKANR